MKYLIVFVLFLSSCLVLDKNQRIEFIGEEKSFCSRLYKDYSLQNKERVLHACLVRRVNTRETAYEISSVANTMSLIVLFSTLGEFIGLILAR